MTSYVFPPRPPVSVAIEGTSDRFPVHRIYCVGRNYADHVREMGGDPRREAPIFFSKPADAVVESGAPVPYPQRSKDFHHEIELVVALGRGGRDISADRALEHVFGYAAGNDLTRRDLQHAAKQRGEPWDVAKGFDRSAPVAAIRPVSHGHLTQGRIWLKVNGTLRQESDLEHMLWKVPQIIAELSALFELRPGDLIFTGTPAGVGLARKEFLKAGDVVKVWVEGVGTLVNPMA